MRSARFARVAGGAEVGQLGSFKSLKLSQNRGAAPVGDSRGIMGVLRPTDFSATLFLDRMSKGARPVVGGSYYVAITAPGQSKWVALAWAKLVSTSKDLYGRPVVGTVKVMNVLSGDPRFLGTTIALSGGLMDTSSWAEYVNK